MRVGRRVCANENVGILVNGSHVARLDFPVGTVVLYDA